MQGQERKFRRKSSGIGLAANPAKGSSAGWPPPTNLRGDPLRWLEYQRLIQQHLGKLLDELFTEFTGLHFLIAWAPSRPDDARAHSLPAAGSGCCQSSGAPWLLACRACGPKQLARALQTNGDGHRFTCRHRVRNYWLPIRVRGETLGLASMQALQPVLERPAGGQRGGSALGMSRLEFDRAARLLRLVVEHLQMASLADVLQKDLEQLQQAQRVLANGHARLQQKPPGLPPPSPKPPLHAQAESHSEKIVRLVLHRIQQDYAQPLTLRQCAADLRLNAAYLSHVFSLAVGRPFKAWLTEVRLGKARELLGDPAMNISQVASAVGYASANRFRIAFKQLTGVAPGIWRAALPVQPRVRAPAPTPQKNVA